jgi:hypothetical protein
MTFHAPDSLSDRIDHLLPRIAYRKPSTKAEKAEIYALRYRCYLREDAILPDQTQHFSDPFDDSSNCHTVGLFLDGRLFASVRIHLVTRHGETRSPAMDAFPDILSDKVNHGDLILDPNRLVVDHDASRAHPELAYIILRVPVIAAEHFAADLVTATVRPEHQAFYRRMLGFETVAAARPYPTLLKPLSLMTVRVRNKTDDVQRRYPFFMPRAGEGAALFGAEHAAAQMLPTCIQHQPIKPGKETRP